MHLPKSWIFPVNYHNIKFFYPQPQPIFFSYDIKKHFLFMNFFAIKPLEIGHPEVLLGKGVLIICSKFTGEHPC